MRAIQFHSFGDAGVLTPGEVPKPSIGPDDVLVRLHAAALNHLDIFIRSGEREKNIPLPHIPGADGAGILAEVGKNTAGLKPGDRVVIAPGIGCGKCEACKNGTENHCRDFRVLGTHENGTYAEYAAIPSRNVVSLPGTVSFADAAAIALVGLTAWQMLITRAHLSKGETVLIQSAGSGVGSIGLQIAKMTGAFVIATAGSDEKLAVARSLGADETINYSTQNIIEEVKRITGRKGVDIVFEHTGGTLFEQCIPILSRRGRLVTCGSTTEYRATLDLRYLFSRQLSILGSFMGTKQELGFVIRALEERKIRPVIDSMFPLEQAAVAHRRLESRQNIGKIILTI